MNEEPLDLHRLLRAISRSRWLVVAFVIGGAVAGALFTAVRPPQYHASTVVLLPPQQNSSGQAARDVQTEVEVATSVVVLTFASKALPDHPSIVELKREVSVSSPTDAVLVFKGRAGSAHDAIAVSNAAANAYQAYSKSSASDQAKRVVAPLNERVRVLLSTNLGLQNDITAALRKESSLEPQSQEYASLTSQVAQWQNQLQVGSEELQSVRNQIANAEATSTANSAISVISPAGAATNNLPKAAGLNVFAGALAGLLLGTTIVIARDSRRRRAAWPSSDISTAAGVPVLASLTARSVRKKSEWFALLDEYEPSPDEQWGLRKLLRSVVASDGAAPASATVVSLISDENALAVAPQLASFAAGAGLRTVLVIGGASRSARALRQVRDLAALSGVAPRENLSLVEEMPTEMWGDAAPVDLVVRLVVTDPAGSGLEAMDGETMFFAVSPSAVTPEQIRGVADAALNANVPLAGIVIANPEPEDADARTASQPTAGSAS